MRVILSATSKGLQVTIDLQPKWVAVGYGHRARDAPVNAAVVVAYDRSQLPLVKVVSKALRVQQRSPVVAIYDKTVQIVFSLSPVTPECKDFALRHSLLPGPMGDIVSLNILTMADIFPEDEAFKIFQRCWEKDHVLSLVLMEVSTVGPEGGDGLPFDVFSVTELRNECQQLV